MKIHRSYLVKINEKVAIIQSNTFLGEVTLIINYVDEFIIYDDVQYTKETGEIGI